MKRFCILAAVILTGCVTTSEVSKIGKDSYMVGTSARGGFTSDFEISQQSISKANAFCASMGKEMELSHTESSGVRGWTPQEAKIQFKCLNEDDPEYQRVNLRKEPNAVIQIQK